MWWSRKLGFVGGSAKPPLLVSIQIGQKSEPDQA